MSIGNKRLIILGILVLVVNLFVFFSLRSNKTSSSDGVVENSSPVSTPTLTDVYDSDSASISTPTSVPVLTDTPTIEPTATSDPGLIMATYPEKIKLSQSGLALYKGQTKQLLVEYEPENIINKKINWSVDNGNILSVTADGLVTALKTGMVTVTVTSENGLTDEVIILILSSQEKIDKYKVKD